jgi:hypothetical protein
MVCTVLCFICETRAGWERMEIWHKGMCTTGNCVSAHSSLDHGIAWQQTHKKNKNKNPPSKPMSHECQSTNALHTASAKQWHKRHICTDWSHDCSCMTKTENLYCVCTIYRCAVWQRLCCMAEWNKAVRWTTHTAIRACNLSWITSLQHIF